MGKMKCSLFSFFVLYSELIVGRKAEADSSMAGGSAGQAERHGNVYVKY